MRPALVKAAAWGSALAAGYFDRYATSHRDSGPLMLIAVAAVAACLVVLMSTRKRARRPENTPGWLSRVFASLALSLLITIVLSFLPRADPYSTDEDWYPVVMLVVGGVGALLTGTLALAFGGYARHRRRSRPAPPAHTAAA